jgi:tRNA pseudouridine38-40 synthase
MHRYFIEVAYLGTNYSGFQVQDNAVTIQSELEKALAIIFRQQFQLTGSSRTDAGVHALQNFFHFDSEIVIEQEKIYNLNAVLPKAIVVKKIYQVAADAHSRFSASSREYKYFISQHKNPFNTETAWHYPFVVDVELLQQAATILLQYTNFTSFSKRKTQVKNFLCNLTLSKWYVENDCLVYNVKANRFLRGMVKGLVSTMLKVGRKQITLTEFENIILAKDCTQADFSAPSCGLFLVEVGFGG